MQDGQSFKQKFYKRRGFAKAYDEMRTLILSTASTSKNVDVETICADKIK